MFRFRIITIVSILSVSTHLSGGILVISCVACMHPKKEFFLPVLFNKPARTKTTLTYRLHKAQLQRTCFGHEDPSSNPSQVLP